MTLAKAIGCASKTVRKRHRDDFYPTDDNGAAARALVCAERQFIPHHVWEPACGDGMLVKPLRGAGFDVVATDLVDRGCPDALSRIDFLLEQKALAGGIITNPPFKLALPFLEHAFRLRVPYVALLLKSTYFHAATRSDFFDAHPPARIYALQWRVDFTGEGSPPMECCWFVWRPLEDDQKATTYHLLRKPA